MGPLSRRSIRHVRITERVLTSCNHSPFTFLTCNLITTSKNLFRRFNEPYSPYYQCKTMILYFLLLAVTCYFAGTLVPKRRIRLLPSRTQSLLLHWPPNLALLRLGPDAGYMPSTLCQPPNYCACCSLHTPFIHILSNLGPNGWFVPIAAWWPLLYFRFSPKYFPRTTGSRVSSRSPLVPPTMGLRGRKWISTPKRVPSTYLSAVG